MSYDSRYPHLTPVDGRPLPGLSMSDKAAAERIANHVGSRTQTRCFFNCLTGKLLFVYGTEPVGGPLSISFKPIGQDAINYDTGRLEAMVEYIRLGRMSPEEKDRIAKQNERAEQQEREALGQKFRDDVRSDVLGYAAFLDQRRRGTQKLILGL